MHARNTLALAGVESLWGFGINLVSIATVLPVFLEQLGAPSPVIALVPSLAALGAGVPQALSGLVGRPGRHLKGWVLWLHVAAPTPIFLTAGWLGLGLGGTVAAVLTLWALFYVFLGFLFPLWMEYMARVLEPARRGSAFGVIFLTQTLAGAAGASVASALLKHSGPTPQTYALIFLLAWGTMVLGSLFFFPTRGESTGEARHDAGAGHLVARLRAAAADFPALRAYLPARWLIRGTYPLVLSFFAVDAVRRGGVSPSFAALLGTVSLGAQAAMSQISGHLGDRFGHKAPVVAGQASLAAAALLLLLPLPPAGYFAVAALAGIFMYTEFICQNAWLMELAPDHGRQDLLSLVGFLLTPAAVAAPLAGGFAMDAFGYRAVAGAVALCAALAFALNLLAVPARRPNA